MAHLPFFKSAGAIHPVIWTLSVVLCMQYVAYLCHTAHLWVYSYDGYGLWVLDFMFEILLMVTHLILTSLLIVIALGYTLLHSSIGELDIVIPVMCTITVPHITLVAIGKFFRDDASDKYHENEGLVGWLLLLFRMLLYIGFLYSIRSTAAQNNGIRLRAFLSKFHLAGSAYFLSYPLIFLITQFLAPYWQHCVMATGLMATNMCSNVWLANIFLKRGDYFKVSTLNCSVLPGGARVGQDKDS